MIKTLTIKNVALIESQEIEFEQGFNVFIGETGAGKSIIFDALDFVLGGKADKTLIRSGQDIMRVTAEFTDYGKNIVKFLQDAEIETDELIISRNLSIEGKTGIRVNGVPVTLAFLKELGAKLVSSVSQHDSMMLLRPIKHLQLIDKYIGSEVENYIRTLIELIAQKNDLLSQIKSLGGSKEDNARLVDILNYQIKEIEEAKLRPLEEDELKEKLERMKNSEKIYEKSRLALNHLDGENSVVSAISDAKTCLLSLGLSEYDDLANRLSSCAIEIEDIVDTISTLEENATFDEREFERLDNRYDKLKALFKKYGGSSVQVMKFYDDKKKELEQLENAEEVVTQLESKVEDLTQRINKVCENLSSLRKAKAVEIEEKVKNELEQLKMKNTQFKISFSSKEVSANGYDNVEFLFSANLGQELKSLSKTASGGELSRLMLALKNVFTGEANVLVFDEIDAGISGEVGSVVAEKLKKLSTTNQILCITHMPQVASVANQFFKVYKYVEGENTYTKCQKLNEEQVLEQIAIMIAGKSTTNVSIEQARQLRTRFIT